MTTAEHPDTGRVRAVVVDFGHVISEAPAEADVAAIAAAAGDEGGDEVLERLWANRTAYDRGDLDDAEYWARVAGRALDAGEIERFAALDVACWSRVRPATVAALEELHGRGVPLALLSNTPAPHARWMLRQEWAGYFDAYVFSYRLRLAKPDPLIFRHTLEQLEVDAAEAVLVDDRPENCEGARRTGMAAVEFTGPEVWDRVRELLG